MQHYCGLLKQDIMKNWTIAYLLDGRRVVKIKVF